MALSALPDINNISISASWSQNVVDKNEAID